MSSAAQCRRVTPRRRVFTRPPRPRFFTRPRAPSTSRAQQRIFAGRVLAEHAVGTHTNARVTPYERQIFLSEVRQIPSSLATAFSGR